MGSDKAKYPKNIYFIVDKVRIATNSNFFSQNQTFSIARYHSITRVHEAQSFGTNNNISITGENTNGNQS